jgi:hypothetical protein
MVAGMSRGRDEKEEEAGDGGGHVVSKMIYLTGSHYNYMHFHRYAFQPPCSLTI